MARKFLYIIAILIVLFIAGMIALSLWTKELTQLAFVPDIDFVGQDALADNAYEDPALWFSRPGIAAPENPVRWQPAYAVGAQVDAPARGAANPVPAGASDYAVFFVHPTSYFESQRWNAPLEDTVSQDRARLFLRGMASPFNQASEIWAPRYRQATFGAFLTDRPQADEAIDAAYRDVEQAFDFFLDSIRPDLPIVLAGHSQGAAHVGRLMQERVVGTPLQARIAMTYAIGWPLSTVHDLPALGLPACATAQQAGCIAGWSAFAEPADPEMILTRYRATSGLDGEQRGDGPILCVNPLTGSLNGSAPASANRGTLVANEELTSGELVAGAVPARCNPRGLLLIGDPPEMGPGVLPGNNYHAYDIPLFWKNLQDDVARRMAAWTANRS